MNNITQLSVKIDEWPHRTRLHIRVPYDFHEYDRLSQKGLGENCIEGRLPDYAYELKKRPKKEVFVFPDAGCC